MLLRRQQWQQRRQRVNGERLAGRQREVLAAQLEEVAGVVPADERPVRRDDLHAQIVELERIVTVVHGSPRGKYYSRAPARVPT